MKRELLAPAGNLEAGYAALYYGADAVYVGLRRFSARAGAENFDEAELDALTAYAHHLGRKIYVAVNTLIQENELSALTETLDICTRCRIDAVILQDLGLARIIRQNYPWLEMHASTQMAVHNREGAMFLKNIGFTRVVLARELTLSEIRDISAIEGLETEAFIHGALCYSYSGLCQFSALENGRSANRGKCAYPCRSCFRTPQGEGHIFSMKDMALGADVLKMPVTSLKIEGRKKSPLYVAAVTDYYRRILDGRGEDPKRAENIRQIFSRPWCRFHFNGKDKNVIDPNFVGHRGLPIGKIDRVSENRMTLVLAHDLGRYDGVQIDIFGSEKPFGFSVQNMKVKGKTVFHAVAGETVEIALPFRVPNLKKGLDVYLASSTAVKGGYDYEKPKPDAFRHLTDIDVSVRVSPGRLEAVSGSFSTALDGKFEKADRPENVLASFRTAFSKTGGTILNLKTLSVDNPSGLFVPVSMINELRRNLYADIRPEKFKGVLPEIKEPIRFEKTYRTVKVDQLEYAQALDLSAFLEIIVVVSPTMNVSDLSVLPKNKVRLSLPAVCRHPKVYERFVSSALDFGYHKWEVGNYWALEVLPLDRIDLTFDSDVYMMNTQALSMAQELGARRVTFAPEDTKENMMNLAVRAPIETTVVVYRDVPLFRSVACIRPYECRVCPKGKWSQTIEKDKERYLAISEHCQTTVLNEAPICIAEETKDLPVACRQIDFCYRSYTPDEIRRISKILLADENVPNGRSANINHAQI